MLYCRRRSAPSFSSRLPGGIFKSSSVSAASRISNFRCAARCTSLDHRRTWIRFQTFSVSLPAKVRITERIVTPCVTSCKLNSNASRYDLTLPRSKSRVRIPFPALERHHRELVPDGPHHYEHTLEGADDMPAHIKASLLGTSVTIPIGHGALLLGTWQGIYLGEHRDDGGARTIVATISGD